MATGVAGLSPNCLFYIIDRFSGLCFLVDTGTEISVMPLTRAEKKNPRTNLHLQAVNNTPITTFWNRSLTLDLGLRRTFRWVCVVADVQHPILGADFLRNHNLLVDMRHNRLTDSLTQLRAQGIVSTKSSPSPNLHIRQPTNEYEAILSEFPAVTQPCHGEQHVKHNITHHIATIGPPVSSHTRRLFLERL